MTINKQLPSWENEMTFSVTNANLRRVETGIALGLAVLFVFAGCSQPEDSSAAKTPPKSDYNASHLVLDAEPDGGQQIIAARESAKDAEEIVLIGRIGGSLNPWVDGRAAFSVVDSSLPACSDNKADGESCSCKTPWDYCCETDKLPNAMALVKFVESDGSPVKHDARAIFGLKELQTVVVKGTAQRDDAGNLTVLANAMYVRK